MTRHSLTWVSETRGAGVSVYTPPGTLYGSHEAYAFQDELRARCAKGETVVVDLGHVECIDSCGVGILVAIYLPGREFTIDLLTDFNGRVISIVPRERLLIRSGVSDQGRTWKNPVMIELAAKSARALDIRGPANIQVKWNNEQATIFEVNPRFSGGIPLTIAAGADFPNWLIQMRCGMRVRPAIGKFTDGLTMACFESAVFLPDRRESALNQAAMTL